MTENKKKARARKERIRLEKAKALTDRKANALFAGILDSLNHEDPGWNLEPTDRA